MRLFTRYILRESCLIFGVSLFSLTALLLMIIAVQNAIKEGLGLPQIMQLLPYALPTALMFAVPGTILFSVSSVYGRMSSSNEIVALKSLGLSPMVALWPMLGLSVALSLATVCLNDLAMSWGYQGAQRVIIDALEEIAYSTLRKQKSFSTPNFSVAVKRVEGRTLVRPFFSFRDGGEHANVEAATAEFYSKPGSGVLTVRFTDAVISLSNQRVEYPDVAERDLVINPHAETTPAHMALRQIPEATVLQRELIETTEQGLAARSGLQVLSGDFDALDGQAWQVAANELQRQRYKLYKLQTEPPRRWANGFSCLCFALVGSGMAIRMRNSDALTSFFLCFGPILIVYYPLLMFGVDRAKSGVIHPYAVWLGNAILALWGLWLLRRVVRY